MDWHPFEGLSRNGYDIAVVWDYENLDTECLEMVATYDEVCVLAWSMGVCAAAAVSDVFHDRLTRAVAVNGTPVPVDDEVGIPQRIFQATLDTLSEASLLKFMRRVCGGAEAMRVFMQNAPQRDIDQLRRELAAVAQRRYDSSFRWDVAVVSANDAIFPIANQRKAWGKVPVVETDYPHLPDFQALLNRFFIDKDYTGRKFGIKASEYERNALIQREVAAKLNNIGIKAHIDSNLPAGKIIEIGHGTGILTRLVAKWDSVASAPEFLLWDIADYGTVNIENGNVSTCDAEMAIRKQPSESVSLIVSASAIQWFGSQARFFACCHDVIVPGGYMLCATYVSPNFPELDSTLGVGLLLPSAEELKSIIEHAGFEIINFEDYCSALSFPAPADLFRHLKATGVNSLGTSAVNLRRVFPILPRNEHDECTLTYHPALFLIQKL